MADIAHYFGPGMSAGLGCGGRGSGEHGAALLAVPPFSPLVVTIHVSFSRTPDVPCSWEALFSAVCYEFVKMISIIPVGVAISCMFYSNFALFKGTRWRY